MYTKHKVFELNSQKMNTKTRQLSEKIIEFLVDNGPGGVGKLEITEESIAGHFNVSRTPVREVLKHLEYEGIINTRRNKGINFREFTYREVKEIYDLRCVLEEFAARQAVSNITDKDIATLNSYVLKYEIGCRDGGVKKINNADRCFHEKIIELSGNWYLTGVVKKIRIITRSFCNKPVSLLTPKEDLNPATHAKIVDSLASRDGEIAARTLREHVLWSRDVILKFMEKKTQ